MTRTFHSKAVSSLNKSQSVLVLAPRSYSDEDYPGGYMSVIFAIEIDSARKILHSEETRRGLF